MPRYIEIIFVRHGDKMKQQADGNEPLTQKGWSQSRDRGKKIGNDLPTLIVSSYRDRANDTGHGIGEGTGIPAGKTKVYRRYSLDFNKPEHGVPSFGTDFEEFYPKHGGTAAFAKWLKGEFDEVTGVTPEQIGVRIAKPLRKVYQMAQRGGVPFRLILVSHGGSNLESVFYTLTGQNPIEIGKKNEKGMFNLVEPFRLIMNGRNVSVHFRGRRFTVQRSIKRLLSSRGSPQGPGREVVARQVLEELAARRRRLNAKAAEPKPTLPPQRNSRKSRRRRR